MLVRPSLLPDEMDRGYLGRVMRLNGIHDQKIGLRALRVCFGDDPNPPPGSYTGTQEYLSRIANVPLERFIANHTTLPWRRAISPYKVNVAHGGADSASIVSISGFRLARGAVAYFCPACIADDQERLGFSYWRRAHQLPGCCACAEHGVPLAVVKNKWAFLRPPAHYLDLQTSQSLEPSDWHAHPLVQRFHSIAVALMGRSQPLNSAVVRQVLHRRGQVRGLHVTSGEVRRPLLSDLVRRSFPKAWLAEVFPVVLRAPKGELLNQLDGVFFFAKGASSVEAAFIALAVLFDTAEDALSELERYEARPLSRSTRHNPMIVDTQGIVEAYIEAFGSHGLAAKACGTSPFLATKKLLSLGLPNLAVGRRRGGLAAAATAFYVKRMGIVESAMLGGIAVAELEALVRQVSPLFAQVLELWASDENEESLAA